MRVQNLIDALSRLDSDAEVYICTGYETRKAAFPKYTSVVTDHTTGKEKDGSFVVIKTL